MERRQFLGRCAAVGGALLGRDTLEFSRQSLGIGSDYTNSRKPRLPHAKHVSGQLADVEGTTVAVEATGRNPRTPVRVRVVRRTYPAGEPVNACVSDPVQAFDAGAPKTVRVHVPRRGRTPGAWFYEVQVQSATDDGARAYLCESRPYQWTSASGEQTTPADRVAEAHDPASERWFERRMDGNEYALSYRWRGSRGATWAVDYRVRRSVHEAAVAGERGYVKTYEESLASPVVRSLADALAGARRAPVPTQAASGEREPTTLAELDAGRRFAELVRFVQHVDYARDAASLGTYDYNRTVPETLVAGVGDCKDLTHLLSGLLATAFDCDTALVFQPGHVLLGVASDDVPPLSHEPRSVTLGGRELVLIDPSLDVPVGYHPDEPFVAAYGGGEWFYHDAVAVGKSVDDVTRDWLDKVNPLPEFR